MFQEYGILEWFLTKLVIYRIDKILLFQYHLLINLKRRIKCSLVQEKKTNC